MSATNTLRNDHKQARRLEKIIVQCYKKLAAGQDIPFADIEQITVIISEFLDAIHYSREEDAYFPCVASYDSLKSEIRAFMIEHEFGCKVAHSIAQHLQSWKQGNDEREPVTRFLRTYAVYLNDHMTKEDRFFEITEKEVLSPEDEKIMYEEYMAVITLTKKVHEMIQAIGFLEQTPWMKE